MNQIKVTQPKVYASHNFPAVTCPLGKDRHVEGDKKKTRNTLGAPWPPHTNPGSFD